MVTVPGRKEPGTSAPGELSDPVISESGAIPVPAPVARLGLVVAPDLVDIVLRAAGGLVDHVLCAIRDDNSDVDLQVVDQGERVQIWARGVLQVTAGTLAWHAGHAVGVEELRSMIVSYRGTLDFRDGHMTLISNSRRAVSHERVSLHC
jgi:hypothetical protein